MIADKGEEDRRPVVRQEPGRANRLKTVWVAGGQGLKARYCCGAASIFRLQQDAGGERAAVIYSLIAGRKLCGIDPFAYLRDALGRVSTLSASRIVEFMPSGWKS